MKKRLFWFMSLGLALVLILSACTSATSTSVPASNSSKSEAPTAAPTKKLPAPVTLRVGAKCGPSPHVMPFFLMMAKNGGKLGDNVTVEYVPVTEPPQMAALLKTQQVDVMFGFVVQTANIFQKGGVDNLRLLNIPLWRGFYVVGDKDVTSWKDLKGKVVVMPNPQCGPSQLARASMRKAGFDPESDFKIQYLPAAQVVQMLITGKAKAGVVSEPFATIAINKAKRAGLTLRIAPIDLYSVYTAKKWKAGRLPIEGILTLQTVLDDPGKAAALSKLESAYDQSIDDMLANPAESSKLIAKQLTKYCDSKVQPKLIEQALSSGRLLYDPTPVDKILPDLDTYLEQMTGMTIDDTFYAQR